MLKQFVLKISEISQTFTLFLLGFQNFFENKLSVRLVKRTSDTNLYTNPVLLKIALTTKIVLLLLAQRKRRGNIVTTRSKPFSLA